MKALFSRWIPAPQVGRRRHPPGAESAAKNAKGRHHGTMPLVSGRDDATVLKVLLDLFWGFSWVPNVFLRSIQKNLSRVI
jgi:hypothetical protein